MRGRAGRGDGRPPSEVGRGLDHPRLSARVRQRSLSAALRSFSVAKCLFATASFAGSVSARASKYRCAELKPPITQAASKMPSNATVLRGSQFSSARAVARDLTEPLLDLCVYRECLIADRDGVVRSRNP